MTRRNIAINTSYFDNNAPHKLSAAEEKAQFVNLFRSITNGKDTEVIEFHAIFG